MSSSIRKICVYTSTRAEYGLLRRLIKAIDTCPQMKLQLLVSGTHLVTGQGITIEEIRADGFDPDVCADIDLSDDSQMGICRSMGIAFLEYGKALTQLHPEMVVILGDRFESFCCAAAAHVCQIPIAHIHGGETTEGAMDESFRHSITKMAHLHFACCDEYRRRVVQLGESPERVHNVGALGVENIRRTTLMDIAELESSLPFQLDRPFFLITFHPVTNEKSSSVDQVTELLAALDNFPNFKCVFTKANADTGGHDINKMFNDYVETNPKRCMFTPSLGYLRYLSAMKLCNAVIGNSSSGLIEAPALNVPTVNIGDRQKGRIRTASVIDCTPDRLAIQDAIRKALDPAFLSSVPDIVNPFEKPDTVDQIVTRIKEIDLTDILKKRFYDLR